MNHWSVSSIHTRWDKEISPSRLSPPGPCAGVVRCSYNQATVLVLQYHLIPNRHSVRAQLFATAGVILGTENVIARYHLAEAWRGQPHHIKCGYLTFNSPQTNCIALEVTIYRSGPVDEHIKALNPNFFPPSNGYGFANVITLRGVPRALRVMKRVASSLRGTLCARVYGQISRYGIPSAILCIHGHVYAHPSGGIRVRAPPLGTHVGSHRRLQRLP